MKGERGDEGQSTERVGMLVWPTFASAKEGGILGMNKPVFSQREGRRRKKRTTETPTLPYPISPYLSILPTHPNATHSLTYLVPQHAFQPILAGSSQVDGQCGSAVLHHHYCLG